MAPVRSSDKNQSQWSFAGFTEPLQARDCSTRASSRTAACTRNRSQWAIHGWSPEVGQAPQRWQSPPRRDAGRSVSPAHMRLRAGNHTTNEAPSLQRSASATQARPSQPRRDADIASAGDSSEITKSELGHKRAVPRPFQPPPRSGCLSQRSLSTVSTTDRNIDLNRPSGADKHIPVPRPLRPQTPQPETPQTPQPLRPQTPQPQMRQTSKARMSESHVYELLREPVRKESVWSGPPPPLRAQNRTLHRGTQVLPSGPMSFDEGTHSAEYGGRIQRKSAQSNQNSSSPDGRLRPPVSRTASKEHVFGHGSQVIPPSFSRAASMERLFGQGSQVMPNGPMCIEGRNSDDYGSMYQRKLD
eukprot:TRINITY_DN44773_c0_g1_i1.p1 TRINITY_DN44773_c0_g1~~TRINITY_DN44773_c0_g1_i1.p1  ORF type:complete len:358 (-),score=38.83 TRINITY_DN44773_c0_g1_i1:195-1268(-)